LQKEMIHFQTGIEIPNDQEDWTKGFRSQKLHVPESVTDWIIFVTVKDAAKVDNLVRTMQKVAGPLGVVIKTPKIIQIENPKSQTYIKAIDEHVAPKIGQLRLVFVVLATNNATVYAAIKKRLTVDFGVNSQCFLAKNLLSKGIMSISTKVVIQMSAKLGGEPWFVKIPIKGMMVVGFETYKKINAVVATMNQCFTQYFSTVTSTKGKLSVGQISSDIEKCLNAYQEFNKELPKYIVVYRAGSMSHDGGFEDVEVQEIKSVIQQYYSQNDVEVPKLTYMIVSKRVNTRLFTNEPCGRDNPPPGTILDNTINVKGRYQFFLVSATARQGTVAPCLYTVIQDDGSIKADKLQILTYKLCHLYFNWSGTVALPAPVQYAHKLAQMTALSYDGLPSHHNLANSLFYL
jgi:aubergine-like protein